MKIIERITESIFFKSLVNKINDLIDNSNELGGRVEFLEKIDTSKFGHLDRLEEYEDRITALEETVDTLEADIGELK